jgi:hypothetical protein
VAAFSQGFGRIRFDGVTYAIEYIPLTCAFNSLGPEPTTKANGAIERRGQKFGELGLAFRVLPDYKFLELVQYDE